MPGEDDELAARAKERLGSVLKAKYRLDRVLGIGGMATVYAATHERNHDRVAVKILHPEISVDKTLRERFLREGYAANSVGHPGTVRVIDDDVAKDGAVFLVMDLLQGETLETRRERMRRLSVAEVVSLMIELLDILAAAHAKLITHRDLKPENLFFTTDGKLKLLDFGVARLREASPARTRSGAIFGTPAYMPPEQALGRVKEVDALSDVWAVGATAFTLISGRYVHDAQTAEEMLVYSATRSAPLLASVAAQVPTEIAAVIDRALTFEKKDRWQSAREMREALVRASASSTASAHDYNDDDDDKTALLAMPQMTLPPVVPGAATVEMATEVSRRVRPVVKASTWARHDGKADKSKTESDARRGSHRRRTVPRLGRPHRRARRSSRSCSSGRTVDGCELDVRCDGFGRCRRQLATYRADRERSIVVYPGRCIAEGATNRRTCCRCTDVTEHPLAREAAGGACSSESVLHAPVRGCRRRPKMEARLLVIRQGSLLAVLFAVGLMAGVARAAGPTKDQCFDASETGQVARKAGRLLNAREHLRICVAAPCPEVVRTDCATRLKEVDVAIPTVVFNVNENGARVSIDGADPIDVPTKPIELDAGNHGFAFSQGGKIVRRIVTLKEGQKDEPVTVVFEAPGDRAKALAPETPPTAQPDRSLSYMAFGVAGVGLVVGIVTGLIAGAKHATLAGQCNDATGTCLPSARDDLDAFHTWRTISTAGYVLGAIGVVSGIVLWLTTPSLPSDRAATVSLFPSAAGLGGRF